MRKILYLPIFGAAMAAFIPPAAARQIVVLPGVINPVGVASGVDTQGPGTLTIGGVDVNTGNDAGGAVTSDAANTASVVFGGSSSVTGFVGKIGTTFLNVAAGTNGNTVTFAGPVYATTFSLSGTGTVNFNGGFTSNTGSTMDFAGDGFIVVAPGQTVKAAITNTAGANTGTLTLNGNSVLNGAVGAASGLKQINVVGGNALITGQVKAATYNLGTNTLNVAGAFAIPVAGTINTTIFSATSYGKITPVGAAAIGNALKVNVTVTGPIAAGTSFNIVDATSGTNGSTVTATSNTTRYIFAAPPTTNGLVKITATQVPLVVVVDPVVTATGPGVAVAVNPVVTVVVAPVIDALPVNTVTTPILTAITLLPTAQAVASALTQLGPGTTNFASPSVSYLLTQRFQDSWASHLERAQEACGRDSEPSDRTSIRIEDASACRGSDMRSRWWATAFGYFGEQQSVKGFEGYNAHVMGAMLAYDTPLNASTRVGVGIRYGKSLLEGKTSDSQGNINSYQVTTYLGYAPGAWYANAALVYGFDNYAGSRHIVFPGADYTANAAYSGHQYTAFGTTGYHIYLGDRRTIATPYAKLQYTNLHTNGYAETGADAIDLRVNPQTYDFVQSGLGAKIARVVPLSSAQTMRPEVHVEWLHAFGGETMKNTAAFISGGPAFVTAGLKPKRDIYDVGTGIVFANGDAWSIEGAYDYQWRADSYTGHQVLIKFVLHG